MNKNYLQQILNKIKIPDYKYFKETDSTSTQAIKWASDGAREYSLVIADSQSAGRGRNKRTWITTPGASIAVSIILYPTTQESIKLGLFSLLGGLALSNALITQYNIPSQVKWPNDVLIDNKKTAGVLAEAIWQGNKLKGLVLGIGINVLPPSVPRPDVLLFPSTCIQSHTEVPISLEELLGHLLHAIITLRKSLLTPEFIQNYESKLAYKSEIISLDIGDHHTVTGHLLGINRNGEIILREQSGKEQSFPIGDIKLRPQ
ncbi:MAG: biotin--[acetyl-CoA-carboxylase] ligase [Anaerolineaceae bacterium]|nr:biotin--[acetyl-CoA-carboxylase] ligase [Anaerolineaceae bacterium]